MKRSKTFSDITDEFKVWIAYKDDLEKRRDPKRETRATASKRKIESRGCTPRSSKEQSHTHSNRYLKHFTRPRESCLKEFIPYPLNLPTREVVMAIKRIGDSVLLPEKKSSEAPHDMNKYCDFHKDHGHNTEQCYYLRKKIVHLLKVSQLREFLSQKGEKVLDEGEKKGEASSSRSKSHRANAKTINMFVGGLELSGST